MGKKIEKEKNELVEEFFKKNDPKKIKSMSDMYAAWKDFFAPAFQQLLDAEMELFDYVNWYNNIRIHSSLNYLTPIEYKKLSL